MQTGVYSAQKKDGTVYYRANITYQTKHISLGSFSSEEDAHSAYLEACNLLENEAVTLFNIHSQIRHLSFDKAVCLLNFRDNHLYFHNPIYLRKGYFSYFLSDDMELKFDIDDRSSHPETPGTFICKRLWHAVLHFVPLRDQTLCSYRQRLSVF